MKINTSKEAKEYDKLVKKTSPKPRLFSNFIKAFIVGGLICVFGELIINLYKNMGMSKEDAGLLGSITLIFCGAFLTGFDIYDSWAQAAGAGTIIPITGFANSIAASAIEFKKEGYVLGVGAKMFNIAGPVIVYGSVGSVILGLIYYLINYVF